MKDFKEKPQVDKSKPGSKNNNYTKMKGFYIVENNDENIINDIATNGCSCRKVNTSHLGNVSNKTLF